MWGERRAAMGRAACVHVRHENVPGRVKDQLLPILVPP